MKPKFGITEVAPAVLSSPAVVDGVVYVCSCVYAESGSTEVFDVLRSQRLCMYHALELSHQEPCQFVSHSC